MGIKPGKQTEEGCPARAGIGPGSDRPSALLERLPRASGDRPFKRAVSFDLPEVAPRERG